MKEIAAEAFSQLSTELVHVRATKPFDPPAVFLLASLDLPGVIVGVERQPLCPGSHWYADCGGPNSYTSVASVLDP